MATSQLEGAAVTPQAQEADRAGTGANMKLGVLGASGRTGRLIVAQALARGDSVRALVRSKARLAITHPLLEIVEGEATNRDDVAKVAQGVDALVSALGPTTGRTDVCSTAAKHVIAAQVPRYVAISGAGLDLPGDKKDFVGRLASFMVRTITPAIFRDKVDEHTVLAASDLNWTLVRPPRLVDKPGTGNPRVSLEKSPGALVARADLASFALRAVSEPIYARQAPFVAT